MSLFCLFLFILQVVILVELMTFFPVLWIKSYSARRNDRKFEEAWAKASRSLYRKLNK